MFDREKQGAYALEVEARDGAASARPNSNGPNSGNFFVCFILIKVNKISENIFSDLLILR